MSGRAISICAETKIWVTVCFQHGTWQVVGNLDSNDCSSLALLSPELPVPYAVVIWSFQDSWIVALCPVKGPQTF